MSKLPCLTRNFLESFASQIWIPFLHNSFAFVQPLTNQRSSSAIPCQNTCFVGRGDTLLHRLNLIWTPKMERVPVPEWYFVSPDTKLCFVLIVRFTRYLFYFSCFKGHKIISICILRCRSIKTIYYSQLLIQKIKDWSYLYFVVKVKLYHLTLTAICW